MHYAVQRERALWTVRNTELAKYNPIHITNHPGMTICTKQITCICPNIHVKLHAWYCVKQPSIVAVSLPVFENVSFIPCTSEPKELYTLFYILKGPLDFCFSKSNPQCHLITIFEMERNFIYLTFRLRRVRHHLGPFSFLYMLLTEATLYKNHLFGLSNILCSTLTGINVPKSQQEVASPA